MKTFRRAWMGALVCLAILGAHAHVAFPSTSINPSAIAAEREQQQGATLALIAPAFADEAPAPASTVAPSPAPAEPSLADKIAAFLEKLGGSIPLEGIVITVCVFVYDFIRRKWPTKVPASLWKDAKRILLALKGLLEKIDAFGDRVFGQNTK